MTKLPKVYIAGPMAGHENKNKSAFQFARDMLENLHGLPEASISNPWEVPPYEHESEQCPNGQRKVELHGYPDKHAAGCYYRTDLFEMLQCQAVVFLPGWENSVGSRLEMQVATACGLALKFMDMKTGEVYNTLGHTERLDWWEHLY